MYKFKTKKGQLTRYALSCGYVEQIDLGNYNRVTMSLEPNGFHFKGFVNGVHFWDILEDATIKEARKYYNQIVKRMKGEIK